MRVLVNYVDFHSDNYQGASGKSFEFKTLIEVPRDVLAENVKDFVLEELDKITRAQRPFTVQHESKFVVQSMEIL